MFNVDILVYISCFAFSSVQSLSCVWLVATPWTAAHQTSLSITNSWTLLKLKSVESVMPSNHLILSSRFSSQLQSFAALESFQMSQFSTSGGQRSEFQLQHQSFQWVFRIDFLYDGLVQSSCCPRDSQESSPIPQFKSINSLMLSFLYSPTLTSIHDYWNNRCHLLGDYSMTSNFLSTLDRLLI